MFTSRVVKEAKLLAAAARKVLDNRRDLLSAEKIAEIEVGIRELKSAIASGQKPEMESRGKALEELCKGVLPRYRHPAIREYCEVILVAFVLAAGIRAYFLQPFKIPTGSMQPTLNGIIAHPSTEPPPALPLQWLDIALHGRTYVDVVAQSDEVVQAIHSVSQNFFHTRSEIVTNRARYPVWVSDALLRGAFGVRIGQRFRAGEPIARGYVNTGDHVFVDKFSYHFIRPKVGDVFVFKTTGIVGIEGETRPENGSQFYIKRIAGAAGDTLRIDPPDLYINGAIPQIPSLLRVMSRKNGYTGYVNRAGASPDFMFLYGPQASFTVPEKSYFALCDNSSNSQDSRSWGVVPERNVVGRGFLVYWPFIPHWGLIH